MKHLGDITKIDGRNIEIVDCIIGGSPCQDLSVAGKRAGLAGERSGLFMEQIRIVKEMRDRDKRENGRTGQFIRPRFMVWENVPGAFSSNKGEDFRAVLEETAKVAERDACIPRFEGRWPAAGAILGNRWSIAWRVHDAQFWGVPQRRQRISVVADFGGCAAPEVLFERKGLRWDPPQGGEAWEGDAEGSKGRPGQPDGGLRERLPEDGGTISFQERHGKPGGGKGILIQKEHVGALSTVNNQMVLADQGGSMISVREDGKSPTLRAEAHGNLPCVVVPLENNPMDGRCKVIDDGVIKTLSARMGTGGNNVPLLLSYGLDRASFNQGENALFNFSVEEEKVAPLVSRGPNAVMQSYCIGNGQVDQLKMSEKVGALNCMHDQQAVITMQAIGEYTEAGVASSLKQRDYKDATDLVVTYGVVRRLTPLECERLQGFPDGWTDIGEWMDGKGKSRQCADSLRYKALGNSIALPFWFYLLRRISAIYSRPATMGSLFDGIGGFPLCWERCNGRGTAKWASEIEEFPIAITKLRFPEDSEV